MLVLGIDMAVSFPAGEGQWPFGRPTVVSRRAVSSTLRLDLGRLAERGFTGCLRDLLPLMGSSGYGRRAMNRWDVDIAKHDADGGREQESLGTFEPEDLPSALAEAFRRAADSGA